MPADLHTVAVKAAPLVPLLELLGDAGLGCEAASRGEIALALRAGVPPERIVFDAPAKTRSDIRFALARGISLNVDGWQELDRIDEEIGHGAAAGTASAVTGADAAGTSGTASRIGVRVNPQRGAGAISAMSTATETSKFGVGLRDPGAREALVEVFASRPWLTQLHVHSGSQGMAMEQMALGIRDAVELAEEIDSRAGRHQVTRVDIGGGLTTNFSGEDDAPAYAEYRAVLEEVAPALFSGRREIVTEFGRSLLAKAGTLLTRVEYTKSTGGRRIAVTHAGVQVATRTVFAPEAWPLRLTVLAPDGTERIAPAVPQDVAGPACFAGDLLARGRLLPRIETGDLLAVHDTGAYSFSTHFGYNALPRIRVLAHREEAGQIRWRTYRDQQSCEELLAEAGAGRARPLTRE
ncbi:diaminopimelate decarboxylase [Brevibacterium album]|uniref:diaminopimelate decarboxylase n=1 Tax=Brevibacterium album TaxID=417948 RepID=UPI001B7F866F|nr:diaminopimelate decarboxylase [Brevibacterium album]